MGPTLPAFTPLEDSLWLTLCCRALDNRRPTPVLGDAMADQIVRTSGYDYEKLKIDTNLLLNATIRAKKMDEVASRFIDRHPDAVGVDLGAGLDTRQERLAPPDTVEWYDVDFPEVVTARRELIPERPHTHNIAADVNEKGWLDAVPSDKPAIIVADGLFGFLSQDEVTSLLDRLVEHFPSGNLVFNSYTKFAVWAARHSRGTKTVADLIKFPGVDNPRDFEQWNPKLQLIKEILISREPEVAQFPSVLRLYYKAQARSTAWSRKGTIVLHYRF
ncbi:class I SAM-dependent methyltransferase [Kribbella pittospori]|uniref:Class I SAM-dependent methyltransferase n=1 Tax=Kribbella pittospori TaxID=722689 RepID=A0A4R0KLD3_9ACTN|nr:class I SAM-dependent methyltransferase [Kribbella pittospori]TCC56565.1 class I SAM-dependent methyltransferase [Kribbella pittospori]